MSIYKRGGCDKEGTNGACSRCGKKRGSCGVYWYKFMWQGKLVRESTKQGNDDVARQMEAAHRTSLAKGEVGIREKTPVPTLKEFCDRRFQRGPRRLLSTPAGTTGCGFAPGFGGSQSMSRWRRPNWMRSRTRSLRGLPRMNRPGCRIAASPKKRKSAAWL